MKGEEEINDGSI